MPSQWPAVGAETDTLRRARQLQRSWERLLADGALGPELPPGATAGLRPTIVESWQRSLATGLDPTDLLAPIEADESEVLDRWFEHPLGSLTHVLTEQLRKVAEESRSIVVVTDASGLVLYRMGDEWLKERAAEQNHLVEGARWSEAADGTNGIGTALAADHAFQVFAFEHFNERHHEWICSGAPVHDPVSGQMVGLIDLSNLWKVAHPRSLELVTTAARTIEQCLVDARSDRDARLRRRYSDLMTKSTDLLVDRDGYVLDGAELTHSSPFDIPEGGGEVVLGDGSVAVAAPLGQGEAYLVRQGTTRHAKSAPAAKGPERAEERARELATEQAALRQVATLVARESPPDQLFAVVAEQVARVFDVPLVRLLRYEPDDAVVVGGFSEGDEEPFPIGSRWPLDSPGVIASVRQTGRPARVDDYAPLTGETAAAVRDTGMRSAVATPIVVQKRLWGVLVVPSPRHEPFPEDAEARLTDFTELVATAIANAESRAAIGLLIDEQAALRRVATLVARGTEPATVFRAVCTEAQALLGADQAAILRFHHDRTVTVMANSGGPGQHSVGTRVSFDPGFVVDWVHETHQAARFDTGDPAADVPEVVRMVGVRSAVGSPIVVDGELWGVIVLASVDRSLPLGMERRLADFTELVASAIANAESRVAVTRLADEQAALRRVATLVAQDAVPAEIFAAVSAEVDRVFGLDPATFDVAVVGRFEPGPELVIVGISKSVDVGPLGSRWPLDDLYAPTHVLRTGRSARIRADDVVSAGGEAAEFLRHSGYLSQVASPIVVDGRLWGAMLVTTRSDLPPDTEERLEQFTELVATAIANTESREALAQLAEEQAALRRVATLVAENVPSGELCAAVTQEAGRLLGTDYAGMLRYEDDATVTVLASWAATGELPPIPDRFRTEPGDPTTMVAETRQPARVDDWTVVPGPLAAFLRDELAVRSSVGSPIVVAGRLWGVLGVHSKGHVPLPADTESRIGQFTELVATAIANREARTEVARLADEQAALRRVATLVARGAPREEVFTGIASEIGHLFGLEDTRMVRYEDDRIGVIVASSGPAEDFFPVGYRIPVDVDSAVSRVLRTGEPVRIDDYGPATGAIAEAARSMGIRCVVAAPISVEGRLWGAMTAGTTRDEPLPPDTESRLGQFTELMATAVANTESRAEVERLADEQAALRRVATLVAEGSSPSAVLDAVAAEMERALGAAAVMLSRYEPDEEVTVVARRVPDPRGLPLGTRVSHQGENVTSMVRRTGRPARLEDYERARGPIADLARAVERNVRSAVGAPIVVDGRLWGVIVASWGGEVSPPGYTEERMAKFAQLLDTAIANADGRDQLTASRARLLTAGDEARRRVVRDLHDGAQQRLVHTIVTLKLAQRAFRDEDGKAESLLGEALDHAEQGNRELRELAHGILPAVLTRGGLRAGVDALVARVNLPVRVDVPAERFPAEIEASAYFIVAEALTNVVKHSHAGRAAVTASLEDGILRIELRDNGSGGADPDGHGLVGMRDRVTTLGGLLKIESPAGGGTLVAATLPLHAH